MPHNLSSARKSLNGGGADAAAAAAVAGVDGEAAGAVAAAEAAACPGDVAAGARSYEAGGLFLNSRWWAGRRFRPLASTAPIFLGLAFHRRRFRIFDFDPMR
jgi:hypothetical protein